MKEYVIKDKVFAFPDLSVEQMELVSEILADTRKKIFENAAEWDMQNAAKIAFNISEILNELRVQKKLAKLISYVLVEKGKDFSITESENNLKEYFSKMPYDMAEEVYEFFFHGGIIQKILVPSFLLPQQQKTPSTASESTAT